MDIQQQILKVYEDQAFSKTKAERYFNKFLSLLDKGEIRSAEKVGGDWTVHEWVKKGILLGFRLG